MVGRHRGGNLIGDCDVPGGGESFAGGGDFGGVPARVGEHEWGYTQLELVEGGR
jgi:hypothetical protein